MSLVSQFEFQAAACGYLGSPLYAAVLAELCADLRAGGPCGEVLRGYDDAPGADAVPLRLLAAVHALVLSGQAPALAPYYPSVAGPEAEPAAGAWPAFRDILVARPDWIRDWLTRPPQTNEVGRAVPLMAGLLAAAAAAPLPVRLLELGASAGLNLRADRFRCVADDIAWGPDDSAVTIPDAWHGPVPAWLTTAAHAHADLPVVERLGCDPMPLDPAAPADRLALRAYVWPDQAARAARLAGALRVAEQVPAEVVALGAAEFLAKQTLRPGTLTVVWHSVMSQYVPADEWRAAQTELARLAADATPDAGFAHISFEPQHTADDANGFLLTVTIGDAPPAVLARAVPHGVPCWSPDTEPHRG